MADLRADYVIVGAGSAGCVVADRLSEDGAQVVLIEAGPTDWHPMIHIPAGALHLRANPLVNWNYYAEPEKISATGHCIGRAAEYWAAPVRSMACSMSAATRPITTAGRRWAAAVGPTPTSCPISRSRNIMCPGPRSIAARAVRFWSRITGRSCR